MITKSTLEKLYSSRKLSMAQIAKRLGLSINGIQYWMNKQKIKRRARNEAVYVWHNPNGNPFSFKKPDTDYKKFLYGLGIGLFWGEGMKLQKGGVRLGNTDPFVILYFRDFLEKICGVSRSKIKYSLQLFGDVDKAKAVRFWCNMLLIEPAALGKISYVKLRGQGTYKKKNELGVMQVACHNTKLKEIIDNIILNLKKDNTPL